VRLMQGVLPLEKRRGRQAPDENVLWYRSGLVFRLIDSCITQLKARGLSRTCNESKEEAPDEMARMGVTMMPPPMPISPERNPATLPAPASVTAYGTLSFSESCRNPGYSDPVWSFRV